jgi:hypothetical protein
MSVWTAVLLAASVQAAEKAGAAKAPNKDKEAVTFREVERGIYLGASAGPLFVINPPATTSPQSPTNPNRPFSPGQMAEVEVGMDIMERLSVGAFFAGTANREGADYTGTSGGLASGDFGMLIPGLTAKFLLLGFNDSQGTTRTYIYARGRAGYAFYYPGGLLPNANELYLNAAAGVEYYTRLRHFSIGLEGSFSFLAASLTTGFAITPSLRYAF